MALRYLFAVDPSLTASGWALFNLNNGSLIDIGAISPPGPSMSLALRLELLQNDVTQTLSKLSFDSRDLLVCEGPAPLVHNPISAIKVEHVRGIFETVARGLGGLVPGRLNPRTIQSELLGMRGKQLARKEVKPWARSIAQQIYGAKLTELAKVTSFEKVSQDMVDAVLVGTVALARVRSAVATNISLVDAFEANKSSARNSKRGMRWNKLPESSRPVR